MRVVQSFARERQRRALREVNDEYRAANHETVVLNGLYFPFVDFLSSAAMAVVLGYGGYRVIQGDIEVGTLFAFIGYLANFFDLQQLSQLYNTFLAAVAALDKIIDVMDEEPEVRDRLGAAELPHRGPCPLRERPLRLRLRAGGPARDRLDVAPGRAWLSSGIPARASRRWRSFCPLLRAALGRITLDGTTYAR